MWAWSRTKDNVRALPWEPIPHAAEIMHRDTVDTLRAGENWHWGYQAVFTYDTKAALASATCPVMFVCGEKDISYPIHALAAEAYPQHRNHVYEHGETFYAESHPEILGPELVDFVDAVNAGQVN